MVCCKVNRGEEKARRRGKEIALFFLFSFFFLMEIDEDLSLASTTLLTVACDAKGAGVVLYE